MLKHAEDLRTAHLVTPNISKQHHEAVLRRGVLGADLVVLAKLAHTWSNRCTIVGMALKLFSSCFPYVCPMKMIILGRGWNHACRGTPWPHALRDK